jgi:hypothetical protein
VWQRTLNTPDGAINVAAPGCADAIVGNDTSNSARTYGHDVFVSVSLGRWMDELRSIDRSIDCASG